MAVMYKGQKINT